MKNDQIIKKYDLITLLIKYVEVNKIIFPIRSVRYLTNEEIIKILKYCIANHTAYNPNYVVLKKNIILEDKDLKDIYPLIKESMDNINYDYMKDVKDFIDNVELRKKGKKYSFEEHLKELIISLLSNHRWGDNNIRENMKNIDKIFNHYDKNYLKTVKPSILINKLKKIHCSNPMLKKQMESLSNNILVLEKIEKDYGSLDNFVSKGNNNDIVNLLCDGKYKLTQVGRTVASDYLRRVGINISKSSKPLERLFGSLRLGAVENAISTEQQVLGIIKKIAILNNCDEIVVESIIRQFCLLRSANICGVSPKCEKCKIRKYCNYNREK